MTALTVQQTAAVLRQAGWPEVLIPVMVAIAKAESGLRTDAVNTANSNGTVDRGLLQINSVHGYDPAKLLSDPVYNAKAGLAIYQSQKLNAWSTWKYGKVSTADVNNIAAQLKEPQTSVSPLPSSDNAGHDPIGDAVTGAGKAVAGAAGAVGNAAGDALNGAKNLVTKPLSSLMGDVLKVGLQLVLVAAGVGLVVLGVNAAASSTKTGQSAQQDAAALAPLALA